MKRDPTVQIHHVEKIHHGKVFSLQQETVTLPNGLAAKLDVIHHPGAVAIVPMANPSHVVLVRQYRHAVGDYIWEIPAGTLSEGEAPLDCARRELREETGYHPGALTKLGEIVPVPGYSDERIHLYLATDLRRSAQSLDEDEVLDVEVVTMTRACDMIDRSEIIDAKTIVGLLRAQAYLATRE
jgi:ADP-ribose pyrophosphatase